MPKLAHLTKANMLQKGPLTNVETHMELRSMGGFNPRGENFNEMFPDGDLTIDVIPKRLQYAGQFKDLFPKTKVPAVEGSNETPGWTMPKTLLVKNYRTGETVRVLRRYPDGSILLDPMSKNPDDIMMMRGDDPLFYEPWMMDYGSIMFVPQDPPIGIPRGKPLKLGTEWDDVETSGPVERKMKPLPVGELPDWFMADKSLTPDRLEELRQKRIVLDKLAKKREFLEEEEDDAEAEWDHAVDRNDLRGSEEALKRIEEKKRVIDYLKKVEDNVANKRYEE